MKDLRIFVASSRELMPERNALAYFALKHEEEFEKRGFRVRLSKWEYVDPHATKEHTEERYLGAMRKSDAALILFKDILGKYTRKEFEEAVAAEKNRGESVHLKTHQILFKEGADVQPSEELAVWRDSLPEGAYATFADAQELERHFLALVDRLATEDLRELNEPTKMRTVNAFFASDDELAADRDAFADLILDLNDKLRCFGVRVKLRFYTSERHQQLVETSEMAMIVYYTRIGAFGEAQMNDVFDRATRKENPRRLYVSFRYEEGLKLDPDFAAFMGAFENERGHFVSRFKSVDSLKKEFFLSLLNLLGEQAIESDVKLDGAYITFSGLRVADMYKLPMITKNQGLNELREREIELEAQCRECWERCETDPSNDRLYAEFRELSAERLQVSEQIERELKLSLDLAKRMASFVVGESDVVLLKARAKLENGARDEAQRILDAAAESHVAWRDRNLRIARAHADDDTQTILELRAGIEVDTFRSEIILADTGRAFKDRFADVERIFKGWMEYLEEYATVCSRSVGNDVDKFLSDIQGLMSAIYYDNGREADALPLVEKSVDIYRRLQKAEGVKHDAILATALRLSADLHRCQLQSGKAEREYAEALEILHRLDIENAGQYDDSLATTLNNLAHLYLQLNRLVEAESAFAESLQRYRRIAKGGEEGCVAMALNNIALVHVRQNRLEEAESEYVEALAIRRYLASLAPALNEGDVAEPLNNLANLHAEQGRLTEAEDELREALVIRRHQASENPGRYDRYVAGILYNLAKLHMDHDRLVEAEAEFSESAKIRRHLAEVNPERHCDDYARTLYCLALVHTPLKCVDMAEFEIRKAMDLFRLLSEVNEGSYADIIRCCESVLSVIQSISKRL